MDATVNLVGGGGSALLDIDRTNGQIGNIHVRMDYSRPPLSDSVNEYVTRMNSINPRMRYSLAQPGPDFFADYTVLPEAALGRHEFYDWIEREHGVRYFIGARIFDEGPPPMEGRCHVVELFAPADMAKATEMVHAISVALSAA